MSFLFAQNLTEQQLFPGDPWSFVPAEMVSAQVRHDKISRQEFYRNPATRWNYYTGVEASNPNARISKINPPRRLHAFVFDFDLPVDQERVLAGINEMKFKPMWVERSLGGNYRLVWPLARPLLLDGMEFAVFLLQKARGWLQAEVLPGLDAAASEDPARLYCNGCNWTATGGGPLPEAQVQAFFVSVGKDFTFKGDATGMDIPLDVVEKALAEKYPNFSWPGPFEAETAGPSFWIPDSMSPMSAILKKDGFFTFSAHAEKPFYGWKDILDVEFCQKYETESIAFATGDKFYDGRNFWRKFPNGDKYDSENKDDFIGHLRTDCRIPTKPDKTGISMLDRCLAHIRNFSRVKGGAPFLFQPKGLIDFNGNRFVNTFHSTLVAPSDESECKWGAGGNFSFVSGLLDALFDPAEQKDKFLAWFRHFYVPALNGKPLPGQNIFLAGGAGAGKTLLNRAIIGGCMGGFTDVRDYLMGQTTFGGDVFEFPLWCIDDETISDNDGAHRRFTSMVKKAAANQQFQYHNKFEKPLVIPWMGRIIVTLNLDEASSRTLPALDGTIMDKVSFFRCVERQTFKFPGRYEIRDILSRELPNFLRWLVDWETPADCLGDERYGIRSHHESSLLDRAHQASHSAPFKELWMDYLKTWFPGNPDAAEWRGSVTQVMRALSSDPTNDLILRSLRVNQVNRYLESLAREKVLNCRSENGQLKTRIWVFPRAL